MTLTILLAYAYLVGSVPTAYIIGRLVKGIDIRQYGSDRWMYELARL